MCCHPLEDPSIRQLSPLLPASQDTGTPQADTPSSCWHISRLVYVHAAIFLHPMTPVSSYPFTVELLREPLDGFNVLNP